MKKLKVLAIILIVLLVMLTCSACVESVDYAYYVSEFGQVTQKYTVKYDKDAEDAETVRAQVMNVINTLLAPREGDNFVFEVKDEGDGSIVCSKYFDSLAEFYKYLGYTGNESNTPQKCETNFFTKTYFSEASSYLTDTNIAAVYNCIDVSFLPEEITTDFTYTYMTPYKNIFSNANNVTKVDGIYAHTWTLDYANGDDYILMCNEVPNMVTIYLLIIGVSVLSLLVIFVIMILGNKKRKKMMLNKDNFIEVDSFDDESTPANNNPNKYKGE